MDEQLRAYAETRRRQAGEPFTLPPETRRVLRAEVDRQFGQPATARPRSPGWWETFWPYVAVGGSTAVLLAVCAAIWWQGRPRMGPELASAGSTAKAAPPLPAAPARPAGPVEPKLARSPVAEGRQGAPPAPSALPPPATRPSPSERIAADAVAPATQPATVAAPTAPPPAREPAAAPAVVAMRLAPSAPLSQRYQQQAADRQLRRNFNSPPAPVVLNDFRFEQHGNNVRITDADGSVYVGAIEVASAVGPAGFRARDMFRYGQALRESQTIAEKPSPDSGPRTSDSRAGVAQAGGLGQQTLAGNQTGTEAGYWFNAVGTNRSLGQEVVVAGRLAPTNAADLMNQMTQNAALAANLAPGASNVQQQSLQQLLLNNSRVQGRVTIGGRTQMEFNALPAGQ